MHADMGAKSEGQKWHRITHRVFTDFQHRCMRRTAAEEWNLAANYHEQDITTAEFLRTYMSVDFPGGALLRRLENEVGARDDIEYRRFLPAPQASSTDDDVWLRHFEEFYGFRGTHPSVFLLSPWEFLMWWQVRRLPAPSGTHVPQD